METNLTRQYLSQVQHFLICGRSDRIRLLGRCKELVESFQQENPEAGYSEMIAAFGEPDVCAEELLSSLEESRIETARKKHVLVSRIVIAVLSVIMVGSILAAFFWYLKYFQQCEFDDDHILMIDPAGEITEEEYYARKSQIS